MVIADDPVQTQVHRVHFEGAVGVGVVETVPAIHGDVIGLQYDEDLLLYGVRLLLQYRVCSSLLAVDHPQQRILAVNFCVVRRRTLIAACKTHVVVVWSLGRVHSPVGR